MAGSELIAYSFVAARTLEDVVSGEAFYPSLAVIADVNRAITRNVLRANTLMASNEHVGNNYFLLWWFSLYCRLVDWLLRRRVGWSCCEMHPIQ